MIIIRAITVLFSSISVVVLYPLMLTFILLSVIFSIICDTINIILDFIVYHVTDQIDSVRDALGINDNSDK